MHARRKEIDRKKVESLSGSNTLMLSDGSGTKLHKPRISKYRSEKLEKCIVNSSCELQLELGKSAMHIHENES